MAQYLSRIIGKPKDTRLLPFDIHQSGQSFFISSGRCYSAFTYAYDSLVPVKGLYTPINIPPNQLDKYYFYLDFTVLPNLQVSEVSANAAKVGRFAATAGWTSYPDQYLIKPYDIKNTDGTIKQIINGKQQEKCYLLLGKIWKEKPDIDPYKIKVISGLGADGQPKNYYLSIYNNCDIIMMGSNVSGTSIVFPMPYFGASYYKTPEEYTTP